LDPNARLVLGHRTVVDAGVFGAGGSRSDDSSVIGAGLANWGLLRRGRRRPGRALLLGVGIGARQHARRQVW